MNKIAQSTSHNPLRKPWSLTAEEFARRAKGKPSEVWKAAQEESISITDEIVKMESEIDTLVKSLSGI